MALKAKQRGESISEFARELNGHAYAPSRATLARHVLALERGEDPLKDEKESGRPALVSEEQWAIVCG